MDRTASKRVFLRMNKAEPANAFWSQASPAEVVTLLVNYMGFPRDLINRAYPIKSGWCVEVREQQHRSLLVKKAKEKGLVSRRKPLLLTLRGMYLKRSATSRANPSIPNRSFSEKQSLSHTRRTQRSSRADRVPGLWFSAGNAPASDCLTRTLLSHCPTTPESTLASTVSASTIGTSAAMLPSAASVAAQLTTIQGAGQSLGTPTAFLQLPPDTATAQPSQKNLPRLSPEAYARAESRLPQGWPCSVQG
jgi:hypothetical protein